MMILNARDRQGIPRVARITVLADDEKARRNMQVAAARAGVLRFMPIPDSAGGALRYLAEQSMLARRADPDHDHEKLRDEAFARVDAAYAVGGTLFSMWVKLGPDVPSPFAFATADERDALQDKLMRPFYDQLSHVEGEHGFAQRLTDIGYALGFYSAQELVD